MKKFLHRFGPAVLLVAGILMCCQAAIASFGNHGVITVGTTFDAGRIKAGSKVLHTIHIVNLSNVPIVVTATPSCGCTLLSESYASLRPLSMTSITASVNTDKTPSRDVQAKEVMLTLDNGQIIWRREAMIFYRASQPVVNEH